MAFEDKKESKKKEIKEIKVVKPTEKVVIKPHSLYR